MSLCAGSCWKTAATKIGALFHDAAEDQGGEATLGLIRAMYGEAVARLVHDCTDSWVELKPAWRPRKEAYNASFKKKPDASLLVSPADTTHNARAILADYKVLGEDLWPRFSTGRETLWYYTTLAEAFDRLRPCALSSDFRETVAEFRRLSS